MTSNLAGIEPRTLRRFTVHADGTIYGPSGKQLSPFPVKGYLRVTSYVAGKYVAEPVHRLVCEAFHGPAPEGKTEVAHINGDPMDNRADNLRWTDRVGNEADKVAHGTAPVGERHGMSKLTAEQVEQIKTMPGSSTEVAAVFGVSGANVRRIRSGQGWSHMTAPRVLRPYQTEAVEAVKHDWANGTRRVGVVLPTGAGKSTVIGKLASDSYREGKRVVLLAHRAELLDQMIRDMLAVDPTIPAEDIGIVRAELDDHHAPIVAATLQTLGSASRLEALGHRDVILWDEVHHAGAESWNATFRELGGYSTALMAGFTATMHRAANSRVGLGDIIEKVSYERDLKWAITNGFLVHPQGLTVRVANLNALNDVRTVAGDFHQGEMATIMEAATEYVVDAVKLHAADRHPIIFAASVDAAHQIADALTAADYPAVAVTGEQSYAIRQGKYEAYRLGFTRALVTVMVLTEGADFPMCDAVVLARPTRSSNLYSQMVGRALRLYDGKDDALVLDLAGSTRSMRLVSLTELLPGAPVREVSETGELLMPDEVDDEPTSPRTRIRRQGPVDMVTIDLLGGTDSLWLETPAGVPFISLRDGDVVFMWPEGGKRGATAWAVGHINTRTGKGGWTDIERYIPLERAIAQAEAWIVNVSTHDLPSRGASWRRSQAPSEAQLRVARGLKIVGADQMTKAALSDEISVKYASRVLDPAMEVGA